MPRCDWSAAVCFSWQSPLVGVNGGYIFPRACGVGGMEVRERGTQAPPRADDRRTIRDRLVALSRDALFLLHFHPALPATNALHAASGLHFAFWFFLKFDS